MPYVERVVVAGAVRETRKMFTGRVHTEGMSRASPSGRTSEAQAKANERKAEEVLRWRLNANFGAGDYHVVLHYYDKEVTLERAEKDKRTFLALLRKECKARGVPWKYVACTETKRMTNIHHHVILPAIDVAILQQTWNKVVGATSGGNVSIKPLDARGNHAKLAKYLMKETKSTVKRNRDAGKRYKRFSCAQGMVTPEPEYRVIQAAKWSNHPKARKNYILLKGEDGEVTRSGVHEYNGWPWMEYTELWTGPGTPPGGKIKKGRNGP